MSRCILVVLIVSAIRLSLATTWIRIPSAAYVAEHQLTDSIVLNKDNFVSALTSVSEDGGDVRVEIKTKNGDTRELNMMGVSFETFMAAKVFDDKASNDTFLLIAAKQALYFNKCEVKEISSHVIGLKGTITIWFTTHSTSISLSSNDVNTLYTTINSIINMIVQ